MGRRPLVACFAAIVLASLVLAPDAIGCSCVMPGPPCQGAFEADAVFAGTVRSISPIPDDRPVGLPGGSRPPLGFLIQIEEVAAFRGVQTRSVVITTPFIGGSCGYEFVEGERYLIYAYRDANGNLSTSICSRTRRIADAGEDLRFFESLSLAPDASGARVYGTVTHLQPDFTGDVQDYGPLSSVAVTARGTSGIYRSQTDAGGRYELRVPAGRYSVVAEVPPGFSQRNVEQRLDLRDTRGCHQADFVLHLDGRITGTIASLVGEAAGIYVELVSAEATGQLRLVRSETERTHADGRFEFTDLPPGRYRLGLDLTRTMREGPAYPRTFYPGTEDPAQAAIIELGAGQRLELSPMLLPRPRRQHRMVGVVTLENGMPAAGSSVSLWDGREPWRQVAIGVRAGPDGTFAFVVHEGLEYRARAFLNTTSGRQLQGATAPFTVTADTTIKMVLTDSPQR